MSYEIQVDMVNGCLLAIVLALSMNLLLGFTRQISVAHAAFGGVGAYAATWASIQADLPFGVCVAIGVGTALLAGILVGLPSLGLRDEFLILLTLCAGALFSNYVNSAPDLGGAYGLLGIMPVEIRGATLLRPSDWLPYLLIAAGVVALICWLLTRSPYGRLLRALGDEPTAASALGVRVQLIRLQIFVVAAGLAGFAGALSAYYNQVASPGLWDFNQTLLIIIMVIIGGTGSLLGTCLGAVVVTVLPRLLQNAGLPAEQAGVYSQMIFAALLIFIVVLRPGGVLPRRTSRTVVAPAWNRRRRHGAGTGIQEAPARSIAALAVRGEGLTKHFGGVAALRDVTLELPVGQISALVGPNGAGKTTLFNALTGFLPVERGTVHIGERDVSKTAPGTRARLGLVRSFQDVRAFGTLSALDNVCSAVPARRGHRVLDCVLHPLATRRSEIHSRAEALYWLHYVGLAGEERTAVQDLSFAEQKLIALARTLASGAHTLLLDEPLSGVDEQWVDAIMRLLERLRDEGHTICIVEHSLHVVSQLASHVFFMDAGAMTATGTIEELMARPDLADLYFGASA